MQFFLPRPCQIMNQSAGKGRSWSQNSAVRARACVPTAWLWRRIGIRRFQTTEDYEKPLANPKVDAVAISTPVSTHFPLAVQALEAGKHVLIEKPLAASSAEAEALIEAADRRKLVLMVDQSFVYTSAVRKIG
jgi:predicted dehydrogenase